jgi:myo-inositol-1(or 4)-monophosphatase
VAYKLSLVAAGLADATWSLVSKHEWDVAAGVALVRAAGGAVRPLGGGVVAFNRPVPRVPGLLAAPPALADSLAELLGA